VTLIRLKLQITIAMSNWKGFVIERAIEEAVRVIKVHVYA